MRGSPYTLNPIPYTFFPSIMEHGNQQGFGGMGADDLAPESGVNQVRHPADVIDVGMG